MLRCVDRDLVSMSLALHLLVYNPAAVTRQKRKMATLSLTDLDVVSFIPNFGTVYDNAGNTFGTEGCTRRIATPQEL
jgi:hypothetical protein